MIYTIQKYIESHSPIEKELSILFQKNDALVIFDIGSCEGEDSIKYSRIFSNSHIYSFEALPKNQDRIRDNIQKYSAKNISLFPIALSDKKGNSIFYVSSGQPPHDKNNRYWDYDNKSSSLLEPDYRYQKHEWLEFNETIKVRTDTIENVCNQNDIAKIDLIHMDVQGAELKVLEGAKDKIKKIKSIWLEVEKVSLYKNQPLNNDIEKFFSKNNFIKIKDTTNSISGDHLYINTIYFNIYKIAILKFLQVMQKISICTERSFILFRRLVLKLRSFLLNLLKI